jgi:glycosyltransferase involved in cell wall biosynthesis
MLATKSAAMTGYSTSEDRIVVLTEMGAWSASTRYRALQHVPRLRRLFSSVAVSLPSDGVRRPPGRAGQALYFAGHAAQYERRARALPSLVRGADAVFVQRGLYALGPGWIAAPLQRFAGRLVFDLDDAVFEPKPSLARRGPLARWLYGPQQALALMQRADEVVVSSADLADMLPNGVRRPSILPTILDPAHYRVASHDARLPVVVGWAGTVGGLVYLDPLEPVFRQLAADGVATLEVVSSAAWRGPSTFRRWRLSDEITIFDRFSVGIMPLPDTAYTRAKAGFKLLQYMAAGIPVVSSPIGVNSELVERSRAGFLADDPIEWERALRTLAGDVDLRQEMGRNGRAFVERYADLDGQAMEIARLLRG